MKTAIVLIAVIFGMPLAGAEQEEKKVADRSILGSWTPIAGSGIMGELKRKDLEGQFFHFKKEIMLLGIPGSKSGESVKRRYKVDLSKDPHWLDIMPLEGEQMPLPQMCIFKFEGEKLIIHLAMSGAPRPKSFVREPEDFSTLTTFERTQEKKEGE